MAEVAPCPYSKRAIVEAGKALAGSIRYDEESSEQAIETFRIAHSWRLSAIYPMRRVRAELSGKLKSAKVKAITAARLKRMTSIRKKLRTTPFTLYQMQDLAGCRAIVSDQAQLRQLMSRYLAGESAHAIIRNDDHIATPKEGTGYRSHHLTFKFADPEGSSDFNRHFVEVQFRTQMQHTWATAVEAVGLVRGEDLKGGSGDAGWLRLFQLVAGQMAEDEGTARVPGVSADRDERRSELADVVARLNALQVLDGYNRAIRRMENSIGSGAYYLIQYNTDRREVQVSPFRFASLGSEQYADAERNRAMNAVLVEVDRVADLRQAYPNYFLDVEAFAAQLRKAIRPDISIPQRKAKNAARPMGWFEDWKAWRQRDR